MKQERGFVKGIVNETQFFARFINLVWETRIVLGQKTRFVYVLDIYEPIENSH